MEETEILENSVFTKLIGVFNSFVQNYSFKEEETEEHIREEVVKGND